MPRLATPCRNLTKAYRTQACFLYFDWKQNVKRKEGLYVRPFFVHCFYCHSSIKPFSEAGIEHFNFLLNCIKEDVNNATIEELNACYALLLHKEMENPELLTSHP